MKTQKANFSFLGITSTNDMSILTHKKSNSNSTKKYSQSLIGGGLCDEDIELDEESRSEDGHH